MCVYRNKVQWANQVSMKLCNTLQRTREIKFEKLLHDFISFISLTMLFLFTFLTELDF